VFRYLSAWAIRRSTMQILFAGFCRLLNETPRAWSNSSVVSTVSRWLVSFLMLFCQMIELSDDSTLSEVSLSLSSRNTSSKPRPPTVQRLQPHRTLAGRGVLYLRYKISMNVRSGPLHRSTASESKTDVKALYIPVLGTIHVPKPRTDGFPYISTLLPSHNHCE
jgi:hypothetical protein